MCTDVYSLASPVILPCGREKTNGILVLGDAPSEFDDEPTAEEEIPEGNADISVEEQTADEENAESPAEEQDNRENEQDEVRE